MGSRRSSKAKERLRKKSIDVGSIQQAIQENRFLDAVAAATRLLEVEPNNPDALYCLAVAQRYLGDLGGALQTLDELDGVHPNYGRTWQERGHILAAQREITRAVTAYEEATRLNYALIASWRGLESLAEEVGRSALAASARRQIEYLSSLPKEILSAHSMLREGRGYRAEQLTRRFLQAHPKHAEAMRLLAAIATDHGIYDDAEFLLDSAVAFEPENRHVRFDYIDVLHKRQKFKESLAQAEWLMKRNPRDPANLLAWANQCLAAGDFDRAIQIYDRIIREFPRSNLITERMYLTFGHALKARGDTEDAITRYKTASFMRPQFGDAYWSLANLKTYQFDQKQIDSMYDHLHSNLATIDDQVHLHFALGKAHEDQGAFKPSFKHYSEGNRLRRQQLNYSPKQMTERLRLQREVCTREFFGERREFGIESNDPIFIVGLPRSGSTLLEQILASHSRVEGTLELHHIGAYAQRLDGRRRTGEAPHYPGALRDKPGEYFRSLAEKFLEDTSIHRTGKPLFIDKMPNNFRHVGLIRLMFPNAKIIDARREPMACCFSVYKQLFASGQEFSYGLEDVAGYYRDYLALMDHWESTLDGYVLRVQYEDVVGDLEHQVRRILQFCGLDFEESCLSFYETKRAVRTPSSEQVRQPIYDSGVNQWRNFEPWLQPLKESLGDALNVYRS